MKSKSIQFPFEGGECPVALRSSFYFFLWPVWKWVCWILALLGYCSSLFCERWKNRCKSTSCQPDKAKTSVSLPSCVSWISIYPSFQTLPIAPPIFLSLLFGISPVFTIRMQRWMMLPMSLYVSDVFWQHFAINLLFLARYLFFFSLRPGDMSAPFLGTWTGNRNGIW